MKIERAIEILEKEQEDAFMGSEKDWKSAVKLGIEALKRLQEHRTSHIDIMRTSKVVSKVGRFRDYYGFDIPEAPELKTKHDCLEALQHHKRWLEEALTEALTGVDSFIRELGIEWE